jgi:hypothetical protein
VLVIGLRGAELANFPLERSFHSYYSYENHEHRGGVAPARPPLSPSLVELNSAMAPWCIELDLELAALAETFLGEIPYREVKSIGVVVDGEDKNGRRCSSPRDDSL